MELTARMKYRDTLYSNYHSTQSGRSKGGTVDALFAREKNSFSAELVPLLEGVNKDVSILDVGCGPGALLSALQDAGFNNASGMDLSPEQVAVAKSLGVTNVSEGNALEMFARRERKFDVVFAVDVIEHFTKDELVAFLQDVQHSINQGGLIIVRTPNMDSQVGSVFSYGDFTHESLLNANSAKQVFLACGFQHVNVVPSLVRLGSPLKEMLRKIVSPALRIRRSLELLAAGISSKSVVHTPNMIIVAKV